MVVPGFPPPEELEPFSMPPDDGSGLDDGQARAPVCPEPCDDHSEDSVQGVELRALDTTLKNGDLLTKSQVFKGQPRSAPE